MTSAFGLKLSSPSTTDCSAMLGVAQREGGRCCGLGEWMGLSALRGGFRAGSAPQTCYFFLRRQERSNQKEGDPAPRPAGSLRFSINPAAAELGLWPRTVLADYPGLLCDARRYTTGRGAEAFVVGLGGMLVLSAFARWFGRGFRPADVILFLASPRKSNQKEGDPAPRPAGSLRFSINPAAAELGLWPRTVLADYPGSLCDARRCTTGKGCRRNLGW